jgi:hypothetical protein
VITNTQTWKLDDFLARSTDVPFEETTLRKVLVGLPSLSPVGPWVAGGALRRTIAGKEPESDFDFFFRDAEQLADFRMCLNASGFRKVRETDHHVHYRGAVAGSGIERDIQMIRFKFYQSSLEVIDSFDFTICQFAFDGDVLTAGEFALWDLGRHRLAINRITYPVSTMRRMLKYARQGFKACNGALTTILRETASDPALLAALNIQYVD